MPVHAMAAASVSRNAGYQGRSPGSAFWTQRTDFGYAGRLRSSAVSLRNIESPGAECGRFSTIHSEPVEVGARV